jgi:hypothetical protein
MKKLIVLLCLFTTLFASAQLTTNAVYDAFTLTINPYLRLRCDSTTHYSYVPQLNFPKFMPVNMNATSNVIKPETYGATGNGIADDGNAIIAAFNASFSSGRTVFFTPGKTYLASTQLVIDVPPFTTTRVWAEGATLKMKSRTRYSMIFFKCPENFYTSIIQWRGGTIDGNQTNQIYPGNVRGGTYDGAWQEDHGALILADWFNIAVFYNVKIIHAVVDGISIRKSFCGTVAYCSAKDAAPLQYATISEQGTAFKVTRNGYKYSYAIGDTAISCSIGIQASFEQKLKDQFDTTTTIVVFGGYYKNNSMNAIHIEDCARTYIDSVTVDNDNGAASYPQILFSNLSRIVSVQNSYFRNQLLSFSNSVNLRAGLVKNCTFLTDVPVGVSVKLRCFIEGGATFVANSTFTGTTTNAPVKTFYAHNILVQNYGTVNNPIIGAYMVDSSTIKNGTKGISFRPDNENRCYFNTFINVGNKNTNKTPPDNWDDVWNNTMLRINIANRTSLITAK